MYDIPGMTELYGPGTGLECSAHDGMHYWADYYILEIVDPETLEPVPDGEVGEMVVTTLRKEAVPLIRYRTRDLTSIKPEPCACGRIIPRHDRILGRSDDMFIVKAVNIYPGQIDNILSHIEGIGSEYQVVIERAQGRDLMTLRVERSLTSEADHDPDMARVVRDALRKKIMVTPSVEIVPYASLPRSEKKTKRVFDNRENEA
jgi:phenylacetate-CoA ligase